MRDMRPWRCQPGVARDPALARWVLAPMDRDDGLDEALRDLVVLDEPEVTSAKEAVDRDAELGRAAGNDQRPPTYRIWENRQCLVVTPREERLPGFDKASRASSAGGWPVVTRESGGTAVPHARGILQTSILVPQHRLGPHALEAIYRALCDPVRAALAGIGVDAGYGEVPGSFCDGRFNLVANGRKIAGTSQRWRGGLPPSRKPGGYVIAHMVLFVDADMTAATEAVNRFYRNAGEDASFDPRAVITVSECLSHSAPRESSRDRLTKELRRRIRAEARGLAAGPWHA